MSMESDGASAAQCPPTPLRLKVLLAHHLRQPIEAFEHCSWNVLLELPPSVRPVVVGSARLDVAFLCLMGCRRPEDTRMAGIDTIAVVSDPLLFEQLAARFSRQSIKNAYLVNSEDAVLLAGSQVAERMDVTLAELLERCRGVPASAHACIEEALDAWCDTHPLREGMIRKCSPLVAVPSQLLIDCNVHLPSVRNWQFQFFADVDTSSLSRDQMLTIGIPLLRL